MKTVPPTNRFISLHPEGTRRFPKGDRKALWRGVGQSPTKTNSARKTRSSNLQSNTPSSVGAPKASFRHKAEADDQKAPWLRRKSRETGIRQDTPQQFRRAAHRRRTRTPSERPRNGPPPRGVCGAVNPITRTRPGERGESRGGVSGWDELRHPLWPSLVLSQA